MHSDLKVSPSWVRWIWPFALLLFYIWTMPENYSEAEDAYDFAFRVEQGTLQDQLGVNRLLALPIISILYKLISGVGLEVRAFTFMVYLNQILAVGSLILFYRIIYDQLVIQHESSVAKKGSWLGVGLLGLSYGFWRYASVPETYMLAIFFLLLAWFFVLRDRVWMGSIFSGMGVLIHLLNGVPLVIAIGCYYLFQKKWKIALGHGAITAAIILVGYGLCWNMLDISGLGAQHHPLESGWGIKNGIRGIIAFGQCLISGNFLFGFAWISDSLVSLFPSRMLSEEQFMANHMPLWLPWVGVVSLVVFFVIAVCTFFPLRSSSFRTPFMDAVGVWLLIYVIVILRTEAGSMELWIMALIPFWFILLHWIHLRWAPILLLSLLLHNGVAGIFPLRSEQSDYHVVKSAWVLEKSQKGDIICVDYEPILISYLTYYGEAHVVNSASYKADELSKFILNCDGNVWALHSFFEPMPAMEWRNEKIFNRQIMNSKRLKKLFILKNPDSFGGVYKKQD